jgi:iron complex outermembrane receptor protein
MAEPVTVSALALQEPEPAPQSSSPDDSGAQEAGGRLLVNGGTVIVSADPDASARDASIATKTETPLIETPRSVTVVDRATLDDLGAIDVSQAHDFTTGVIPLDDRGPGVIRGFPVDFYDLRRDGLRTYGWSVREPVALDRIQYLRGPASVLYGDGSPGGLVNLVLKKPLPVGRYGFTASGGGLGFGRVTGDATGPLDDERRVRYRVIGAAEWLDNGIDNDEQRLTVMPMLALDVGTRSTLSIDTEIYDQRGRNYRHAVPATADTQHGDFTHLPWNLSPASPDDGWTGRNVAPGVRYDVAVGTRWSVHAAARYTAIDGDLDIQALAGISADGHTLERYHYREDSTWRESQSDVFVSGTARTGSVRHRLVTGLEYGYSTTDTRVGIGAAPPLDVDDPMYGPHPPEPELSTIRFDVTRIGWYALDQISLHPRLIVAPSIRWSRVGVDDHAIASADARLSPGLGVVVLPRPWWSVYATFARGFEPPAAGQYLETGDPLAPADNDAFEAGAKIDVPRTGLTATVAFYRIHRTNLPEADPRGFYRQIGAGVSHGGEVEVGGRVVRGLRLSAGLAWNRTEITEDSAGFEGRELPNAPRHKVNALARYRFPDGPLRRLTVTAGVTHVGDRFVARNNLIVAPSYTRVDLASFAEVAGPRLAIGVVAENVANTRYVTSGAGAVLFAGRLRRVALQLTSAF